MCRITSGFAEVSKSEYAGHEYARGGRGNGERRRAGDYLVAPPDGDDIGLGRSTAASRGRGGIRSEPTPSDATLRSVSMTPPESRDTARDAVATLVVQVAVSKLDALTVIALAVDSPVLAAGSSRPRVELDGGAWAEVEIPKFGEPPPLAIDVRSSLSLDHARLSALALAAALEREAGWVVYPDFPIAAR